VCQSLRALEARNLYTMPNLYFFTLSLSKNVNVIVALESWSVHLFFIAIEPKDRVVFSLELYTLKQFLPTLNAFSSPR
jgi:hypothetical protein